jgi:hypothetical protein
MRGSAMRRLLVSLALCLAGPIFADPGMAQPVGGPTTVGNDPTGGNTGGGNTTGGNTTGGNVNTGGNVGVNVGEERRSTVTFKTFTVYDETGCDWCGSDEAQFVIRTADYTLFSLWYGNLDSPLFYRFDRCAQPAVDGDSDLDHEWECDPKGKAPPFSFTVAAYEDDDVQWPFTGFCSDNRPVINQRGPDIFAPNAGICVEDRGELIGKEKVELTLDDLAELQEPGQFVYKDIELRGGCDGTEGSCDGEGGPHYSIRYEIKRVPDAAGVAPVDPNP